MWRKNDASKDDLDAVAQRLREERPTASPLELDQIKRTAMSRGKLATGGRAFGRRRLVVAGLTTGLMVASAGGVLAASGGDKTVGNAASAQYSTNLCDVENNNDNNQGNSAGSNAGNENNNNNNNFNCNNNSFNGNTTNNNNTTNITNTNTYTSSTVTLSASNTGATGGVQGSKQSKASASKRHFSVHFFAARGRKLHKLTIRLNGKVIKVLRGRHISTTLDFVGVPCGNIKQSLVITGELSNGRKVSETRHYNLCQS